MFTKTNTDSKLNEKSEAKSAPNSNPQQIDITGIDKAALLAGLFNRSRPLGLGFLNPHAMQQMTVEEAKKIVDAGELYFDYLRGRVMKVDLSGNTLNARCYDRDNGRGAALEVVNSIRNGMALQSKPAAPSNRLEELAAAGQVAEAIAEADKHITFSFR